jgi:acyl-CoA dehydrogenase
MAEYSPRLEEINFLLNEVADLEAISKLNGYQHADPETVRSLLEEAGRFFSEVIAPLNRVGDTQGSVLTADGTVKTPDGFKEAYDKFVEAGWAAVHMPEEWGGGGMPYMVGVVVEEMFKTANMAFSLCPMLTHSAVEALVMHGSPGLQSAYLENLVSGQWTGTMNLTEPQAGSDLGAVRTKAEPQDDGSYRIFGTKIFITWGDHDLTPNIIHLVLARTPGSAPGTKGISMFLVPKFLLDENGEPGARNDIRIVSLEHKLGIHASPTCVMSFGDDGEGAVGYLVGAEQEGMRNMFTMMNPARVGVGMEGLAMSERAYQKALAHARERIQGRAVGSGSHDNVAIIQHPDVRRSLMTMRAFTEAMRALLYVTAETADRARRGDDSEQRAAAADRLALLTPIIKAWSTDVGVEMASLGIQVHGGMGYVEETGAAQFFRDSRIAPIYEGTNGIQAIDLVTRKLPLGGGRVVADLIAEMRGVAQDLGADSGLARFGDELTGAIDGLARTSTWLGERLASGDIESALAGATPYMRQIGTVVGGWLMARSALAASATSDRYSPEFVAAKLQTARFYGEQLLPAANAGIPAVESGSAALDPGVFGDL